MKPENRKQLVRGVVGVGSRNTQIITTNLKEADELGCIVAVTHWYRHDDDLEELERDLNTLVNCYSKMNKTQGLSITYEYKDYRK